MPEAALLDPDGSAQAGASEERGDGNVSLGSSQLVGDCRREHDREQDGREDGPPTVQSH